MKISNGLSKAAKLSLRLPQPDKQLVVMCDTSEHAASYVLLVEVYTESDTGSMKSYAPVAFSSQRFTKGQMSLTMYAKEFLATHIAFHKFAHILWGVKKPTTVMTDNKAHTLFFQSKRVLPLMWNYCDQALRFDFVLAYVPGTGNPATDYLSQLEIRPEERMHLKLNDEFPVYHFEIDLSSKTPKQDEDEEYFIPDDDNTNSQQHDAINAILDQVPQGNNESSEQFRERRETTRYQITPIITGQHDEMTFTRFTNWHHDTVVNQVCPSGDFKIVRNNLRTLTSNA